MAETGQGAAWQLSDGELAAAICASEKGMRVAYAQHLEWVAEADRRGLGPSTGARDTAAFLVETQRISWEDARARVAIATADLPVVRAALATGEIGAEHAAEIVKTLAQAPATVGSEQVAAHEETLVALARQAIPSTVHKAGQRILGYWNLGGKEPRDREGDLARPRREFRYTWTRDGRMKFSGEFDSAAGHLAEDLFVPLAKPDPQDERGNPDPRTAA